VDFGGANSEVPLLSSLKYFLPISYYKQD